MRDRKGPLSDQQACALFEELFSGVTRDGKQGRGAHLRGCLSVVDTGEGLQAGKMWTPSQDLRLLPIDERIDELRKRTRAPRLQKPSSDLWNFRTHGPYFAARECLRDNLVFTPNREREIVRGEASDRHLKLVDKAGKILEEVLRLSPRDLAADSIRKSWGELSIFNRELLSDSSTPEWKEIVLAQESIQQATHALERLRSIVLRERKHTELFTEAHGLTAIWPLYFVSKLADLWFLFTGKRATRTKLFDDFVQGAWESLDENIPSVSFERAIRMWTENASATALSHPPS